VPVYFFHYLNWLVLLLRLIWEKRALSQDSVAQNVPPGSTTKAKFMPGTDLKVDIVK
jgi:hypothetical protein